MWSSEPIISSAQDTSSHTHTSELASPSCLQGTRRYGSEDAEPIDWIVPPGMSDGSGRMSNPGLSEMFAYHATTMANTIGTSLVVFTRKVTAQRAPLSSGRHQTRGHAKAVGKLQSVIGSVLCLPMSRLWSGRPGTWLGRCQGHSKRVHAWQTAFRAP